jgi:AraC-like DNA-binding protein
MYQLRSPSPLVARFIEHYWFVRGESVDTRVDVFVDARADLVFNFAGLYERQVVGGDPVTVARSNLDLQRLVPIRISQRGSVRTTGVRFRLGGLAPFTRVELAPFTGQVVEPEAVLGEGARSLELALESCTSIDAEKVALDAFFSNRVGSTAPAPGLVAFSKALDLAVASCGRSTVKALSEATGCSSRTLERLFASYLGVSPKRLATVLRFQVALQTLMRDPGCALADVASAAGYFDQSHFVKEFRRMTGGVPRGYRGYFPKESPTDFAPNVVVFLQDDAAR